MRTTLTIDSDGAERIRQETRTGKRSLKDVINDWLRAGFGMKPRVDQPPVTVEPRTSRYQPGVDTGKLHPFLDDLEMDACRDRLGCR